MIRRAALAERDVLIDLGAGLGHVALLAAICTGARCIGIEREAAYVDCARRCANALNLDNATFVPQDVRSADLSAGTVFYLYTPFVGAMLDEVLSLLKRQAASREIRVCTLGPCTAIVAREPWLEATDVPKADRPALFCSV
nr:class I SAM-dependent methyltransferase [Luteimonas galliterrae]